MHLTLNGEGDLVVMDLDAFYRREKLLDIKEKRLMVEANRFGGATDYLASDVISEGRAMLRQMQENQAGER